MEDIKCEMNDERRTMIPTKPHILLDLYRLNQRSLRHSSEEDPAESVMGWSPAL